MARAHYAEIMDRLDGHALLSTWQRRSGALLTVEGYLAVGGVSAPSPRPQSIPWMRCRTTAGRWPAGLLTRLVRVGEDGVPDTRRRLTRTELSAGVTDLAAVDETLGSFARARLLTLDDDGVQLSHEALIRSWPTLRGWVRSGRGLVPRRSGPGPPVHRPPAR